MIKELKSLATKYKKISFLARTHGQPASPSTLGKEILVFHKRLERQTNQLKSMMRYLLMKKIQTRVGLVIVRCSNGYV